MLSEMSRFTSMLIAVENSSPAGISKFVFSDVIETSADKIMILPDLKTFVYFVAFSPFSRVSS